MISLSSRYMWKVADRKRNQISHKLLASIRKDFPDLFIRRFGLSSSYWIEGDAEQVERMMDKLEFMSTDGGI